jgi:hypothetical protein
MGLIKKNQKPGVEQRTAERRRVLWGSRIAHLDGSQYLKCLTRDISSAGARVHLDDPHLLPESVYFLDMRNRLVYEALVVWRKAPELGLQFLKAYRFDEAPSAALLRLIETEY